MATLGLHLGVTLPSAWGSKNPRYLSSTLPRREPTTSTVAFDLHNVKAIRLTDECIKNKER